MCPLNLRLHEGYVESELTYGEVYNPPFFSMSESLIFFCYEILWRLTLLITGCDCVRFRKAFFLKLTCKQYVKPRESTFKDHPAFHSRASS